MNQYHKVKHNLTCKS